MLLGASWLCAPEAAAAKRGAEARRGGGEAAAAMDESSLLDLLECSVCLERLDTTAKALPCQHTFCRRCLESIVSSRHELRCPECRILVGCGVDELPANILLVRLLDGIRQRPRGGGSGGGSPTAQGSAAAAAAAAPGSGGSDSAASPAYHPAAATGSPSAAAASRSALLGKEGFKHTSMNTFFSKEECGEVWFIVLS
ncbi:solute carrier family 22 member 18 [Platysternon megacephalum]|uniref:Solute carrier family 22 member 18 n=1 Tax=Platysternon megacephalum TaxID=55544 RepID=A0A4D9EFB6_9SAUR|nr:solute carrier family 22 member 18 [Platysternon megacephalum]